MVRGLFLRCFLSKNIVVTFLLGPFRSVCAGCRQANQAAKKAAKRMQSARKIFLPIILGMSVRIYMFPLLSAHCAGAAVQLALPPGVVLFVQIVFLVARVWWGWESFGWGAMFMAALSLGLHYFVYVNLLDAYAHDMSGECVALVPFCPILACDGSIFWIYY